MGAHLGESGGSPFTEHADRKLVCTLPKLSLHRSQFSHQSVPSRRWICSVSPRRLRPTQPENTRASSKPSREGAKKEWMRAASGRVKRAHISGLTRYVPQARSYGADLEDHQSVFRTWWREHRSWSLAILAEFRTPVSLEIVLSVATSAWLHNVAEFSLLTLLPFHCLLRPAEARQLRWCDVESFDGSVSTRYEKVFGIVRIRDPKTRRMAGHAVQQHVLSTP